MVQVFQKPLSAGDVKSKARALGADLVGIADGAAMNDNPPDPNNPKRPSDITDHDADRVIVLAKRLNSGSTRIKRWDERHKYYNDELAITSLEELALELVLWLEDNGYPALIVPPTHVDPWRYKEDPKEHMTPLLSVEHAAVEFIAEGGGDHVRIRTVDQYAAAEPREYRMYQGTEGGGVHLAAYLRDRL